MSMPIFHSVNWMKLTYRILGLVVTCWPSQGRWRTCRAFWPSLPYVHNQYTWPSFWILRGLLNPRIFYSPLLTLSSFIFTCLDPCLNHSNPLSQQDDSQVFSWSSRKTFAKNMSGILPESIDLCFRRASCDAWNRMWIGIFAASKMLTLSSCCLLSSLSPLSSCFLNIRIIPQTAQPLGLSMVSVVWSGN